MKRGNARFSQAGQPPQAPPPAQFTQTTMRSSPQYNVGASNDLKELLNIGSAEDAMELIRQRKMREAQQVQSGFVPQMQPQQARQMQLSPEQQLANEQKCMVWLREQLEKFVNLVITHGNPTPAQAAKLMRSLGGQLTQLLPYPPAEIKSRIVSDFQAVGWDVRTRKPVPHSKPPSGLRICELVYSTGCFMANRLGQQQPADPSSRLAQMQQQRNMQRAQPAQQFGNGNRGNQRGGQRGGQRSYQGKGGKGNGKGGGKG